MKKAICLFVGVITIGLTSLSFGQKVEKKTDLPVCPVIQKSPIDGKKLVKIPPTQNKTTVYRINQINARLNARKESK
jgi:hypothetical protein